MKKSFHVFIPLFLAISFVAGMYISHIGTSTNSGSLSTVSGASKLESLLHIIESEYVDDIDKQSFIEDFIPHILEQLDPHSTYIKPEDYNAVRDPIQGEFEGIGVQFNIQDDTIMVVQVIPGGPSEKVGILPGDRIVFIDDSLFAGVGVASNQVVRLLKGAKGTRVKVGVKRRSHNQLLDFVITRDKIPLHSIDVSFMIADSVGYIKISRFSITTPDEFEEHISKLRAQNMTSLILDLRDNSGGVLRSAILLANEFLQQHDGIVFTKGKNYAREDFVADGKGACKDLKLIVLINEFSASASEIVAGAIQDNERGLIIGRRSFGKGLVNRDFILSDNSIVRLTVQRFYSPSGRPIQKPFDKGIELYNAELFTRTHNMSSGIDSAAFPDSLIFYTVQGRPIFGGGGIFPDITVAVDTTYNSPYFSTLIRRGILYDFAFSYSDSYRTSLLKISQDRFTKHLISQDVITEFITYAAAHGVPFNYKDFSRSKPVLEAQLYAYIARNIHGNELFYRLFYQHDSTIKKALSVL